MQRSNVSNGLGVFLFAVLVGACCSSQRAPAPEPTGNAVVAEPQGPVAVLPEPTHDCSAPPQRACCMAMTPACIACADAGRAELAQWQLHCGVDNEPLPASFDCRAPPPLTPCCRALLPKCTRCVERNRAIEEAYRAQCGPG